MRSAYLPFSPPLIGEEEISEVVDTLRSDWITTGPKVKRFENEFSAYIGSQAALATASATDAMLVGLAALGVGEGDEVITTPMTFCSTAHVIEHLGAKPVFADVSRQTLTIDPERIEEKITPQTKAILPVHVYGHPCDMDSILGLAEEHNLTVLEDAAHAFTATYKGKQIGTLGDLTAFSFYATKNITTGEGGMLTGSPELIDEARIWSLHGMSRDAWTRYAEEGAWYYEVIRPGFKCNMTDIQAAIGIHQLAKVDSFQKARRQIAETYNEAFAGLEEITIPTEDADVTSAWHLYAIRLNLELLTINRSQFIEELKKRNIGSSVHFIPLHVQPYYRDKYGYAPDDYPVAYAEYLRLISLPINLRLSPGDIDDVIEAVQDVIKTYRL
jgi:dTDP-4-amino-4,6-dideoxygalactose transaminase